MKKLRIIFYVLLTMWSFNSMAQSGAVFRDYNANGTFDANEPLVGGVIVNAYDASGALCGTATTTAGTTGTNYSLTGCSGQVRVEFVIPSKTANICGLASEIDFTSYNGTTYGSSVQFVDAAGTANFAIANPAEYSSPTLVNPKLFTSCYVSGDNLGSGNVAAADAFIGIDYNPTGNTSPAPAHLATAGQIGSTWGVAYSKFANKIFTSAVIKRHTGMGPLGSGGIYMIDPTKPLPATDGVTNFFDFDANGIATRGSGTYAGNSVATTLVPFSDVIGTNTERGLGSNLNSGEHDAQALAQAGMVSFGDIDISEDGRYLYVMNLYDKKLYELDLTDPYNPVAPTAAKIRSWAVPTICDAAIGDTRPWSTAVYRGKVYVGLVCNAKTSNVKADVKMSLQELDPATGTFTELFNSSLDFPRGNANGFVGNGASRTGWFPWTDDWATLIQGTGSVTWPQPILSDIEFDIDGSFVLGFIDRSGLQGGWNNKSPQTGDTRLYMTMVGGDLLRVYKNPTTCTWELENNGKEGPSSPKAATAGAGNNEGPGGGEFYYTETYGGMHKETALGGLAMKKGSGEVVSTNYDPFQFDSFGISWYSNNDGTRTKAFEVYFTGNAGSVPSSGTFSKGLTLGDLEIVAEIPSIEIGNRIWNDTDGDGIQDPGEAPIAGVTLELCADFDNNGVADGPALGTVNTDANGTWYFNNTNVTDGDPVTAGNQAGLTPLKNYIVKVAASDWASGAGAGELAGFSLTSKDQTSAGLVDVADSDAELLAGAPAIKVALGSVGQNNHTLDMGFNTCIKPVVNLDSVLATCTGSTANNNGKVILASSTGGDKYGISAGATYTGSAYAAAVAVPANGSEIQTGIVNAGGTYTVRVFNGSDTCYTDVTIIVPAAAPCAAPCKSPNCGTVTVTKQ